MPEGGEDNAKKIEELIKKVEQLENALREVAMPYSEIVGQLFHFYETVQRYFRLMDHCQ